jgi:octaprenyl-diphosphate synthase
MPLNAIKALVEESFTGVNELILRALHSQTNLINDVGRHIVQGGGKRLRPLVLLLVAKACGYEGKEDISLAAIIEFIHTATLLHDDVVDHAELRRGRQTANNIWGNEAAVLVGDFLYSRAMQMMIPFENKALMQIVADAVNVMSEGEILQLLDRHNHTLNEGAYLNIIQAKTAKLFEAAATLGALLPNATATIQSAMAHYGMHLGIAFQLMDDVLDYQSPMGSTGKNLGNDLAEGKVTLPLIHVMQQGTAKDVILIKQAMQAGIDHDLFLAVQKVIEKMGSLEYTVGFAQREIKRAIDMLKKLPASPYREALKALAQFAVERTY